MSQIRKQYSEEFRLSVLREYHSSGLSQYAISRQYGISESLLSRWRKKYESEKDCVPLQSETPEEDMANRSKESYRDEIAALKKRNKELEKALHFSRLETQARDMMIAKAEEYFDIPIRKKSGAK